jgi:hypothetical protein
MPENQPNSLSKTQQLIFGLSPSTLSKALALYYTFLLLKISYFLHHFSKKLINSLNVCKQTP